MLPSRGHLAAAGAGGPDLRQHPGDGGGAGDGAVQAGGAVRGQAAGQSDGAAGPLAGREREVRL